MKEKIILVMAILYVGASVLVIAMNDSSVIAEFKNIFQYAFSESSDLGSFAGATIV